MKTAAIIGGGVIGGGWAARFLLNGWDVRVFDPDPEAEAKLAPVLAQARRALPSLTDVALPDEGQLTFHDTMSEVVNGAVWVQERPVFKHRRFWNLRPFRCAIRQYQSARSCVSTPQNSMVTGLCIPALAGNGR